MDLLGEDVGADALLEQVLGAVAGFQEPALGEPARWVEVLRGDGSARAPFLAALEATSSPWTTPPPLFIDI